MKQKMTARRLYQILGDDLKARPELGLRHTLADRVLEPVNPFAPQATRPPQRWFVLLGMVAVLTTSCFLYFNCR